MNKTVTELDVFLYHCGELDRERRIAIEQASLTDPRVRRWLAELQPTEDDGEVKPIDTASAEYRERLVESYLLLEQDEAADDLFAWARSGPDSVPADLRSRQLVRGRRGEIVFRSDPVLIGAAAYEPTVPPLDIPLIHPDRDSNRLTIRQEIESLDSGEAELHVLRVRDGKVVERLAPVPVRLERTERPGGEKYWYFDCPLDEVIGGTSPGDEYVYVVRPTTHGNPGA